MLFKSAKINKQWFELLRSRVIEVETQTLEHTHVEFERLEFLGDSILNGFITERLFEEDGQQTEGDMSTKKAFLVSNAYLKEWMQDSEGADEMLSPETAQKVPEFSDKVAGAIFEGYIGFMCVHRGRRWALRFLATYFWPEACRRLQDGQWQSYRSLVQMYFQQHHRTLPDFNVIEHDFEDESEHRFRAELITNHEVVAVGYGSSKKKAIESAARTFWLNENDPLR